MENEVLDKAAKETDGFAKQQGRVMSDVTMASELMREAYPQHRYGNASALWNGLNHLRPWSRVRVMAAHYLRKLANRIEPKGEWNEEDHA